MDRSQLSRSMLAHWIHRRPCTTLRAHRYHTRESFEQARSASHRRLSRIRTPAHARAMSNGRTGCTEPAGLAPALKRLRSTSSTPLHELLATATVVTVGRLAAGEDSAWRRIKQARGMTQQVLMARIGIHHRLLFRADEADSKRSTWSPERACRRR